MAAPKRKPIDIQRDLALIEELRVKGWTEHQIADRVSELRPYKISRSQVRYDLDKIEAMYISRAVESRAVIVTRLLREINAVRRKAWEMLEKSAEDRLRVTVERDADSLAAKEGTPEAKATKLTQEKVQRHGDPAILRLILDCNAREAKLLGADAQPDIEVQATTNIQDVKVVAYLPAKAAVSQ